MKVARSVELTNKSTLHRSAGSALNPPRELEPYGSVQLAEVVVEGAEGQMSGFACCFQNQTIRESERRLDPIVLESRLDDLGVLHSQLRMIQEHLDRQRDLLRFEIVDD